MCDDDDDDDDDYFVKCMLCGIILYEYISFFGNEWRSPYLLFYLFSK